MSSNFKKCVSMVLVVCMVIALACLVACKDNKQPEQTTPEVPTTETTTEDKTTTPQETTTEVTTPNTPTETVTFPSDEDNDPKQEDNFFE